MKLYELEKCQNIIGYWLNEDKTVIDKLLNEDTNIIIDYLKPFTNELNSNLLNNESFEAKKDLIKFYIFEFYELQGFIETHKDFLLIGSLTNYSINKYEHESENGFVRKLNAIENYYVKSHELFDMIINEIQICCIKYKIDFYELCNELNFSTEYFDTGVTRAFDEIQIKNDKPKQTNTEQETLTFTNNFDNIKPTEIYEYFKAGLVDKGYLTTEELNKYLKAAFELKTTPETLFKLKHTPTKQKIYTVFYIYYKDIAQKKHERQKEYAALLGDFFEGYKTEIIQTNWARDYKTKR